MKPEGLNHNYARNKDFAREVMNDLLEIWGSVKREREHREEIWHESYRSWSVPTQNQDRGYQGMADLNVPQLRKEVETMARRIYKGLLPEDYLKAEPSELQYEDLTIVNTQLVRHYYDNIIKVKQYIMPWIKQGVLYGTSPIRQYWCRKENDMLYRKRVPKLAGDGTIDFKYEVTKDKVVLYNAPRLRAEDMFTHWIYPHTATNPEEIQKAFSLTKISKHDLMAKKDRGTVVFDKYVLEQAKQSDFDFEEQQQRLAQVGQAGEFKAMRGDGYFDLLEIWCSLVLPGTKYPVMCVVEILNGSECIRIQRNPYWHQQLPFDYMRFIIPPPGEFYGRGLPEAAQSLQNQLNDTMNQTMDSTTLALNNITIINPAYAPNAESFEIEPNAVWWADPSAVKQMSFPDLSASGYKAAGTLRQMISEMTDNQPQLPDPIAGKARSTGQAQLAISEWQTDLFTFIDLIATEALSPMAFKTHSLIQQFIEEDDVVRVSCKYAGTWVERIVTPQEVIGRYDFKWIGALQIENQAIKVQQMLNFLKVWASMPPELQGQVKIHFDNLVIKLLRDGFQIKDIHNIVETARLTQSVPPIIEEKVLDKGGLIKVHEGDNDEVHLRVHVQALQVDKDLVTRALRSKHIQEHQEQLRKKVQHAQMQEEMQRMQQAQMQAEMPQGRGPGNPGQIPESVDPADMERGMGI
jgi:DNA-binding transcriptional MerR regulator